MFCGNVIAQYKNHKLYCDTIFISKMTENTLGPEVKNILKLETMMEQKFNQKKLSFLKMTL